MLVLVSITHRKPSHCWFGPKAPFRCIVSARSCLYMAAMQGRCLHIVAHTYVPSTQSFEFLVKNRAWRPAFWAFLPLISLKDLYSPSHIWEISIWCLGFTPETSGLIRKSPVYPGFKRGYMGNEAMMYWQIGESASYALKSARKGYIKSYFCNKTPPI